MDDERHDPSLEKLLDIGLYDRWGEMPRSTPEERAKIAEVEGTMGALEVQQAKLNDKVTLLEWDFNSNLKYWSQVVDFKAQMLSFALTELVMDHQERVQQDRRVQETFGLHQDRISGMEETL